MDGRGWADFGSASTNGQNDDNDDDWADFGGFESATPAANGSSQSGSGSVITWAAIATPPPASPSAAAAVSFNQPAAQMMPSPNPVSSLTPQFLLNTTTSETSKSPRSAVHNPLVADDHSDCINSFLSTNQDFSSPGKSLLSVKTVAEEDKLNDKTEYDSFHADFSSFLSEALTEPSQPLSGDQDGNISQGQKTHLNGEHPAVGNEAYAASNITAVNQQTQEYAPDTFDTLDTEVSSAQDILSVVMAQQQQNVFDKPTDNSHKELSQQLQEASDSNKELEDKVKGLEGKLSIAEQEKIQLQKDLDALLEKDKTLEEESKNLTELLAKQNEKYEHLQEQHEDQIKEIRKAGHDTLAVIVEEYKELSRKAVLEQQQENKIQMEKLLDDQTKKFQEFLQEQQESFERTLQGERKRNEQKASDLLEEEKQRHKEEIESHLEQERLKSKEALDKAIEDARQQNEEAMEMARKEERRKYQEFIMEHKETIKTITDQEGKRLQKLVEDSIKEERETSKVVLEEVLKEERQCGKEFAQEVKDETKTEMLEYLKAKQEADRAARQKHLHGLDLFLESARAQLKMLMEVQHEKDPED
ncbi:hypothetical protein ACROYT_G004984 [Oculina patagonica]